MSFSNLRTNNQIYILHKDNTPYLESGNVLSVTAPMPTMGNFGQPTVFTVDVTVKTGEQTITYSKLPSGAEVADWGGNGNLVVACSREAMNNELQSMKQKSVDVIASVDYHKQVIDVCDKIMQQLNPEYAEKVQQQEELSNLKGQVAMMSQNMSELMKMNKELMEQLKGEKPGRVKKD